MDINKEREAFEAVTNTYHCIYNADLNYYFSGSKFVGDKAEIEVNAGWKAWQAKSQAVPEGFVLVPKEPTDKTIAHMINTPIEVNLLCDHADVFLSEGEAYIAYQAMIAAQEPAND